MNVNKDDGGGGGDNTKRQPTQPPMSWSTSLLPLPSPSLSRNLPNPIPGSAGGTAAVVGNVVPPPPVVRALDERESDVWDKWCGTVSVVDVVGVVGGGGGGTGGGTGGGGYGRSDVNTSGFGLTSLVPPSSPPSSVPSLPPPSGGGAGGGGGGVGVGVGLPHTSSLPPPHPFSPWCRRWVYPLGFLGTRWSTGVGKGRGGEGGGRRRTTTTTTKTTTLHTGENAKKWEVVG